MRSDFSLNSLLELTEHGNSAADIMVHSMYIYIVRLLFSQYIKRTDNTREAQRCTAKAFRNLRKFRNRILLFFPPDSISKLSGVFEIITPLYTPREAGNS